MLKKKNWISHAEWMTMFIALLGGFYSIDTRIDIHINRMDQFLIAWHEEAKDFHGRLCAIKERNKK